MSTRNKSQTKYFNKSLYKPDPGTISALNSIKQNPKFSKLLAFSINCLNPLITPPNPRHRENANYFISQEGLNLIVKAINDHSKDDEILFNSTQLLIKLIGKGKFKDEKIAGLIVTAGGVAALMNALNNEFEKSKHTIKLILELLDILGSYPKLSIQLIEQNVLEIILKILSNSSMNPQSISKGLEMLCKLLSYPECKNVILTRDLLPIIQTLLSKKAFSSVIVTSALKLLELLSRTSEGIEYMKKNNSLETIVSCMEKHPYDKQLLSNGSSILSKIVTMSDLNNVLDVLKNNEKNESSMLNISIFSQLALIDEMMDEILRQGALKDLIKIMEMNLDEKANESPEKINLIKNCCIALGRIVEVDMKQFLQAIDFGALNVLKRALIELKNPEIGEAGLNTLNKLCENPEIKNLILAEGFVSSVLKIGELHKNDQKCCEAFLGFLTLNVQNEKTLKEIFENNGLEIIIQIMELHINNKNIQEKGVRLLSLLIQDENQIEKIIELKSLELLYKVTKLHANWRIFSFYFLIFLDKITNFPNYLHHLKKNDSCLEALIIILSSKNFELNQVPINEISEKEPEIQSELQEITNKEERINQSQEKEIKSHSLKILSRILELKNCDDFQKKLNEKIFELKQNTKFDIGLEYILAFYSHICVLPNLIEYILMNKIPILIVELSQELLKKKDFLGKANYLYLIIDFFLNLSNIAIHNDNNIKHELKENYKKLSIEKYLLNFLTEIIQKNEEPLQILYSLIALSKVLNKAIASHQKKNDGSKKHYFDDFEESEQKKLMDNIIDSVMNNMKKYPDHEALQIAGVEIFNIITRMSYIYNSSLVKLGVTRFIISKIEDEITSKTVGLACLNLLKNIGVFSKEALILMNNQRAATAIMNFLSHQSHDPLITQTATPLLKLLSTVDNLEIFEELDTDIKELISTLDINNPNFLRSNALESLELLKNFALIDNAFDLIVKNKALEAVVVLLTAELAQDETVLLEKGELTNNDHLIYSALGFINFMLSNQKVAVSKEIKIEIQKNLLNIAKNQNYIPNQINQAIKGIRELLKSKENEEILIENCLELDFLDNLIVNLERYKENIEICQEINGLLLELTKTSTKIAEILSEKDFLRILLKETRSYYKNFINNENFEILQRLRENLNCLKIFALLGELPCKKLLQGNCSELCYNMIHKGIENKEEENSNFQTNSTNFQREIRLFVAENDEFGVSLNVLLPELLNLLIVLSQYNEVLLGNSKEFLDLLKIVQIFYRSKSIVILVLELILKFLTPELKEILLIGYYDTFCLPLNYYPLDDKLELLISRLFYEVNPKLCEEKLEMFNFENINNVENETLVLANSFIILNISEQMSHLSESNKNKEIIEYFEKNLKENLKNMKILSSSLLLLKRMCYQGESIKTLLLKSSIPRQIIENIQLSFKENPQILELSLHTLNKILNFSLKTSQKIDKMTWDYEDNKPSFVLTEVLSDLYVSNKGEHLNELVILVENRDEGYLSINHQAIELLFNCSYLHPAIAAFLNENYGLAKIQDLYEDICKRSLIYDQNTLVMKLCKLISAMARIQNCFDEILKKTNFLQILIDTINNINVSEEVSKENCLYLEEFLWCLGVFSDNNFDKGELIEKRVIEIVFEKIDSFIKLPISLLCQKKYIGNTLIQALKTLKILEKDPSILRIMCSGTKNMDLIQSFLGKMVENQENAHLEGVFEEFKQETVSPSEIMVEKLRENLLNVIVELTKNPLILDSIDFVGSAILDDLMKIIVENQQNLIIVVRGTKILENAIKSLCEREVLKNVLQGNSKIKKIEDLANELEIHFEKVPIMTTICESIKLMISGKVGRTFSEAINSEISKTINDFGSAGLGKSIDQEIEEHAGRRKRSSAIANTTEILTKLGYVSNSFDYFVRKVEQNKHTQSDYILAGKLLASIGNFATNFDKKLKLFNMGVVDSILLMVSNKKIDDSIKFGGFDVLSKIFLEKKMVWKYMMNKKLVDAIKEELVDINAQAFPEIPLLKRNTLKSIVKIIQSLSENPTLFEKLFQEKILEIIMDILLANKEKIDIVICICEALGSMAKKNFIIKEMLGFGCLELLMEFYDKYLSNLPALRAFALLVGEIASNSIEAQEKLGNMSFPYLIIEGEKLYPKDLALTNSSCFSLSWLCYTNSKISEFIVKGEMIKPICLNLIKSLLNEKELMGNICLLLSNLCFKNNTNKQILGSMGSIFSLMSVLSYYTKKENIDEKVLKNCLKALGNLSLLIENSSLLIQNNFVKIAESFLLTNQDLAEMSKFFLDILSNLASFPEEINFVNLMELIDQGIIMLLIDCINKNELNTTVLISSINALDYLCSNRSIRKYANNPNVFITLFKILKSQDWNTDLVIKIIRILIHVCTNETIPLFFEAKLPNTIVDIIKVQIYSADILIKAFKLCGILCIDKLKAKAIFQTGLIPVIFSIAEQTEYKKECIYEIFQLFSKLGKYCDQASEQICHSGFTYIRTVVQDHFDDLQIVEIASLLMQNISDINSNADLLLSNDGIEFCQDILKKYQKSEQITIFMFKSMQNIAETSEDYRKICLEKNCVESILSVTDQEDVKETVKIAGIRAKASIETENKENLPEANEILGMIFKFKLGQSKSLINKEKKNFLLVGRICKLYKNNGDCRSMHISCNPDFKSIIAKRPKKKEEKKNTYKISLANIKETIYDYSNQQIFTKSVFAKSGGLFRKKADPELCISLIGNFPKNSEEKSMFIETPNLIEKQKWIECFKALLEEHKRQEKM